MNNYLIQFADIENVLKREAALDPSAKGFVVAVSPTTLARLINTKFASRGARAVTIFCRNGLFYTTIYAHDILGGHAIIDDPQLPDNKIAIIGKM